MNRIKTLIMTGMASATAFCLTSCSGMNLPDPTSQDYANQAMMQAAHPGMDCVMEWVDPGQYMTNCYPMSVHPPYSVRVYYTKGCTCPPVTSRPKSYSVPKPVVIHHTTVINHPAAPAPIPHDSVPHSFRSYKR